jgi:hypothetical protein
LSHRLRYLLPATLALALAACTGSSPGPLEGTWSATEPFPVTVTFRDGETEAMGRVRKVAYTRHVDEVVVTYVGAGDKDAQFTYTLIDDDTIRSESGTFRRVK